MKLLVAFLLLSTFAAAQPAPATDFDKLVDQFFDGYFSFNPTQGTAAGFHQYDTKLEDYSRPSVERELAFWREIEKKFEAVDLSNYPQGTADFLAVISETGKVLSAKPQKVTGTATKAQVDRVAREIKAWKFSPGMKDGRPVMVQVVVKRNIEPPDSDRELVLSTVKASLLELETIRMWERNPDRYSSGVTSSIFYIMSRNFASQDERLKSVIARERQIPAVFQAARQNLKNVPKIYAEVTLEQLPGITRFFQNDVPKAFDKVTNQKLLDEFKQANSAVVDSLKQYQDFIQKELLPKADGDYRIGAVNFSKKLLYEEMVDIPLERVLEIGMADLKRNQDEFARVSKLLDPSKTPQQILEDVQKHHPSREELIPTFRSQLAGLKSFIETNKILTIPSEVPPIVQETPPFMRALSSASMETPGPYEKVAKEAFFNVTLPDPSWTKEQQESWLQGFNYGTINSTATHEAYPGHYTQFLWVPMAPSKVRKLLGCGTNAEGWAHYTEEMMLEEGFGRTAGLAEDKDKKFLELRLGQLQDALLRNARYIVGLKMHTGQMTYEEGIKFFREQGYQTAAVSERETKRGTSDPTYLMYTLGKLQIMKLRQDVKQKMGDKFSLQQFHDDFLKQGFPPVKLIRHMMLGDDSPTL
jgi:uncharacterized protein (DUF885 family)